MKHFIIFSKVILLPFHDIESFWRLLLHTCVLPEQTHNEKEYWISHAPLTEAHSCCSNLRASMCGSRFPNRAVAFNLEAAQNGIVHCAEGLHLIKTCSMTLFSLQQGGASSVSIMSHFPCCATAVVEVLRAALIFYDHLVRCSKPVD